MEGVCEIPVFETTSKELIEILTKSSIIAMLGLSSKEKRDSNKVAKKAGFNVIMNKCMMK